MKFPWSSFWVHLWRTLLVFVLGAVAFALLAFFALELIGLYCEANGIPGCSTLSYWSVVNYGAETVAWEMTRVGILGILAWVVWILVWNWHAWDVAGRQRDHARRQEQ